MNRSLIRVRRKRFLAFFMALVLVLGMMPAGAMGSDPEESNSVYYLIKSNGQSQAQIENGDVVTAGDQIRRGRNLKFSIETSSGGSSEMPYTDDDPRR